jgi:hypothetical protein
MAATATPRKPAKGAVIVRCAELVLDFEVYPRASIDSQRIGELAEAIRAGEMLPPVIVDRKTKRVVDGFHRIKALVRLHHSDAKVGVIWRDYASDWELLKDAAQINVRHGKPLDSLSRDRVILQAERFKVDRVEVARVLAIRAQTVDHVLQSRVAMANGELVRLKHGLAHLSGSELSSKQIEANRRSDGYTATYHVHQVLLRLEVGAFKADREETRDELRRLRDAINQFLGEPS